MKNIFKTLLLIMVMSTFHISSYAQKDSRQRMTREELAVAQAKYIAKEMALNDTNATKFIATFCQFQKEIWALGPRPQGDISDRTDAEAEQALKERFAHSQKILNLREKYYEEYSKFLSPTQIAEIYELERKMMSRLYHHAQKEKTSKK
ncbi:MAG: hypothetical protein ACK5IJ_04755 [Mangrovibacterium sp.]